MKRCGTKIINDDGKIIINPLYKQLEQVSPGNGLTLFNQTQSSLFNSWYKNGNLNEYSDAILKGKKDKYFENNKEKLHINDMLENPFFNENSPNETLKYLSELNDIQLTKNTVYLLSQQISKMFPNIKIQIVNNETSINKSKAYIGDNGVLYLNEDNISMTTPIHELSHVFIIIAEQYNSDLFKSLVNEAKEDLKSNNIFAQIARDKNPNVSENVLLHELMAIKASMLTSEDTKKIVDALPNYSDNMVSEVMSQNKNFAQRFFGMIQDFINKLFGTSKDNNITTLYELGLSLNKAMKDGLLVNSISSDQLAIINKYGTLFDSSNATNNSLEHKNIDHMLSDLRSISISGYDQYTIDEKVKFFKNIINQSTQFGNKFLDEKYIGKRIEFSPGDNIENKILSEIIPNYKTYDAKRNKLLLDIFENIGKDEDGEKVDTIDYSILDKLKMTDQDAEYKKGVFDKFLMDMGYNKSVNYMSLEDYMKSKGMEADIELVEGLDVIVSVFTDNETGKDYVSLFKVTNKSLYSHNTIDKNKMLFDKYGNNRLLRLKELNFGNSLGDAYVFGMSVISKILHQDENISVNGVRAIQFTNKESVVFDKSGYLINKSLRSIEELVDTEMIFRNKRILNLMKSKTRDVNIDFEQYLTSYWTNMGITYNGVEGYKQEMDKNYITTRVDIIDERLKAINNILSEAEKSGDSRINNTNFKHERNLLLQARKQLEKGKVIESKINFVSTLNTIEKLGQSISDTGIDEIALVYRIESKTNNSIVETVDNSKKSLRSFYELNQKLRGSSTQYVSDQTDALWNNLIAKVDAFDTNGNKITKPIHFLLWSTDANIVGDDFARQASMLSEQDLKITNALVEEMDKYVRKMAWHELTKYQSRDWKNDRDFTDEDLNKELEKMGYKKGMIPILETQSAELFSKMKIGEGFKSKFKEITDLSELYKGYDMGTAKSIDQVTNLFETQFYGDTSGHTKYGNTKRLEMLGLYHDPITEKLSVLDNKKSPSYDVEKLMDFFMMSVERKIQYEDKVLPTVNGIRAYLYDKTLMFGEEASAGTKKVIDYIDMFTERTIHGRVERENDLTIAEIKIEPTTKALSSLFAFQALALNPSIFVMSASVNFVKSFTLATTNTLIQNGDYDLASYTKATSLFFVPGHYQKITQLAHDMQLINMSQYELITHKTNKVTDKNLISDFTTNWLNWSTDMYARCVIMTAQMIQDGSYDAWTYNEEQKTVTYDKKKDKRMYNSDGSQTEDQVAFEIGYRNELINDRTILPDEDINRGFTTQEIKKFKYQADQVIGGYTTDVKANLSNLFLGRMFNMFGNYLSKAGAAAFKKGEYIEGAGRYKVFTDVMGVKTMRWEDEFVEGYIATFGRHMKELFVLKNNPFKNMTESEKRNYVRMGSSVAITILMTIAVNGLLDDEDGKEKKWVRDYKMLRNLRFLYSNVFIVNQLLEKANNPFTMINMIKRGYENLYSNPVKTFAPTAVDKLNDLRKSREDIKEEKIEKAKETRRIKKEEEYN